MKKLLALVLALVMVMALAVSAFAVPTILKEYDDDEEEELIELTDWDEKEVKVDNVKDKEYAIIVSASELQDEDGTTVTDKDGKNVKPKEITAEGTGIVKDVKVVDLDPEVYDTTGYNFKIVEKGDKDEVAVDGKEDYDYEGAKDALKELKKANKTTKYVIKMVENVKVVLFTVAGNNGTAFEKGTLTIKTTDKDGNKYKAKVTIVNDVVLFKYEEVKWAAEEEEELELGTVGYSDYEVNQNGNKYLDPDQVSVQAIDASVIPTTAFRAVKGEKVIVTGEFEYPEELEAAEEGSVTVTIPEVAAGQKSVNFRFGFDFEWNDADGDVEDEYEYDCENLTGLSYNFYGNKNQVIASDYTIEIDTGMTYFEFREYFGKKLEEEDIVTFFIAKDGKAYEEFTIDYMTVDYNEEVKITINGKAGTNLGQYTIALTAAAGEGEENPNTGAESAVAVIAAMAVVSAVAAAAVTLKK